MQSGSLHRQSQVRARQPETKAARRLELRRVRMSRRYHATLVCWRTTAATLGSGDFTSNACWAARNRGDLIFATVLRKPAVGARTVHGDSLTHTSKGCDDWSSARLSQVLALPTLRPSRESQVDPERSSSLTKTGRA